MKFYEINPDLVGCVRLCSFLILVCSVYSLIQLIVQRQKPKVIFGASVMVIFDYIFFHLQLDFSKNEVRKDFKFPSPLADTNLYIILGVLVLGFVSSFLLLIYCGKWEKTHLTVMSVKDSLDNLPVGISYCDTDGKVLLINNKMLRFIKEIEDTRKCNPILSYEKLRSETQTDPIFELSDGSIYILRKNEIYTEKEKFVEYLALDITKKYQLTKKLETENRKLVERGNELRLQGRVIDDVILNREILDTKIKVHNDFGQLLLASKYVLTHDTDEKTKEELLQRWKHMSLLRQEDTRTKKNTSSVEEINRAASAIGVEIIYTRPLPDTLTDEHVNILEHMLHEALTNSFSHAHADKLFVSVGETTDCVEIEITNNGKKPESEIIEGGGLSSLRRLIENRTGEMKIISVPEFKLKASLKK